eukprot:gnl/Dysnectes_brevis/501_a555_3758.p1 GENE.gnl/Dysnectes_brevis/501_a555_3758~~gnl/Dysnectes_brevis/501_a555_3758.p1  ORF type:complete len:372 (+),score=119.70 gnl/Dysnectes_brevis/501_a555_3758:40-1116(+)
MYSGYQQPTANPVDAVVTQVGQYRNAAAVKMAARQVVASFTGLRPILGYLPVSPTQKLPVLCLNGVIQTTYMGNSYNTPLTIFIDYQFPATAPKVFVMPPPSMRLNPRNPYLDPTGRVLSPQLKGWVPNRTSLINTVIEITKCLSQVPACSTASAPRAQPPQPVRQQPPPPHLHQRPPYAQQQQQGQWQQPPAQQQPPPRPVVDVHALRTRVTQLLVTRWAANHQAHTKEFAALKETEKQLKAANVQITAHLEALRGEQKALRAAQAALPPIPEVQVQSRPPPSQLYEAVDPVSERLVEAAASIASGDDYGRMVTKLGQNGEINPLDAMAELRNHTRKQFTERAMVLELRRLQQANPQ